jgi:hypothetical protein
MGLLNSAAEGFVSSVVTTQRSDKRQDSYVTFLAAILSYLVALVILSFVGKLLWNSVVVDLFTVVKPAKSIWHILGFMVLLSLLRP